jgi:hypothetical protein
VLPKVNARETEVGDIVLFVFSDGGSKRDNVWKIGRVRQIVSPTTISIQYSHGGVAPKQIIRSVRSTVLILSAGEIASSIGQEEEAPLQIP